MNRKFFFPGLPIFAAALLLSAGLSLAAHYPDPVPTLEVMTLSASVTVDGSPLSAGDEVAAYSVHPKPGAPGKWERTLIGRHVVGAGEQYLSLQLFGDDNTTAGVVEGAVEGEEVGLLLWRASEGREYAAYRTPAGLPMAVVWSLVGPAVIVDIDFTSGERVPLRNGAWNLFSYGVLHGYQAQNRPAPTAPQLPGVAWDNVSTLGNSFPLRSIAGKYDRLLGNDGTGATFWNPTLPGISTTGYLAPGYGYWVKMKAAAQPLSWMTVPGGRTAGSEPLPLNPGWTLAGYWGWPVYHVPGFDPWGALLPVDVYDNVFLPSIGELWSPLGTDYVRVTSFDGAGAHLWNPSLPQTRTLNYMGPGYGYWVKMSRPGTLVYPSTGPSAPSVATLPASGIGVDNVVLHGTVNPNGASAEAWFEWGSDPSLVSFASTLRQALGSGSEVVPFGATLSGLTPGATYYYRAAASSAGGTVKGSIVNFVTASPGIPPDPSTVAPPPDPTTSASLFSSTRFLYTGSNPIQTGVSPETIDPKRAAIVRGKVLARDGNPLPGARVTVLGHPEYGQTLSRADGMFDLAVNGGGYVTVNYERPGYLSAQRQSHIPWQDFVVLSDVALIPADGQGTAISLSTAAPVQVARGSVVTDADGSRQGTLIVPQGTTGELEFADGTVQSVSALTLRITEYTVGPNGPKAMPAELPANTRYTYCVELSADEAIAGGASTVRFGTPLYYYVENFIGFPVGTAVPTGYYDRQKGQWIASQNGRVVRVLGVTGGMADLDTDGDGFPDNPATLAALGVTDAERRQLASLYSSGATLWRVPIPHLTPWDCNWPYGPPPDAEPPPLMPPLVAIPCNEPDCRSGSVVKVQQQALGETIPVVGTPFSLNYGSDRVPGYQDGRMLTIPVSGDTVPDSLKEIRVEVVVAGVRFETSYTPAPGLTHTFVYDGVDAYGLPRYGSVPVVVRITYYYDGIYYPVRSDLLQAFGRISGASGSGTSQEILFNRDGNRLEITQKWATSLDGNSAALFALGGWSLDVHHAFDPASLTLHTGSGQKISGGPLLSGFRLSAVPGLYSTDDLVRYAKDMAVSPQGTLYFVSNRPFGSTGNFVGKVLRLEGDGTIATVAGAGPAYPPGGGPEKYYQVAVGPDGALYYSDPEAHVVRRVDGPGTTTVIAGTGAQGFSGDGGPATQADLNWPWSIAFGRDGSLYIADSFNYRVRRVATNGTISTVAGSGLGGYGFSYCCDGSPATDGIFQDASFITLDRSGNLFINSGDFQVRKVGTDGLLSTFAGNGTPVASGDGGPATLASLSNPQDLSSGPDGSLYISDGDYGGNRIRRVTPDGIINTVAGGGDPADGVGDGGQATGAKLGGGNLYVNAIAVGQDGTLLITDRDQNRIRKVGPDGIIRTVAGPGFGFGGDGVPAAASPIARPGSVAIGLDGSIYFTDGVNQRVRRIRPDGILVTLVGNGLPGYLGDGGPAGNAYLEYPDSVAFGPDGSLFIAESSRVRRIDRAGIIVTVAGGGNPPDGLGDGGPATAASVNPQGIAAGADGSLYIAAWDRVRKVGPDGYISTVAGGGPNSPYFGDGGPATEANLAQVQSVTVTPDGKLIIADAGHNLVRMVTTDGIINTIAGTGSAGWCGDRGMAWELCLHPTDISLSPKGGIIIADDQNFRIWYIQPDGFMSCVAGNGTTGAENVRNVPFNGPAVSGSILYPRGVAAAPDGGAYVKSEWAVRRQDGTYQPEGFIARLESFLPGLSTFYLIASPGGSEAYSFGMDGRHLRTLDALTGAVRFEFGYDAHGRLAKVTDGNGLEATIERNPGGEPAAIVGPYGHRTVLSLDGNGYLASVANPAGETTRMEYLAGGMLSAFADPKGNASRFSYDAFGRLVRDEDASGGFQDFASARSDNVIDVSATTASGRVTSYHLERVRGGDETRTTTSPFGAASRAVNRLDGTTVTTDADGTTTTIGKGPDPRFGMQSPVVVSTTVRMPSGLQGTTTRQRSATLADPRDPLSLLTQSDNVIINGRIYTMAYDNATRTISFRTPVGRESTTMIDALGQPVSYRLDSSMVPQEVTYDSHGRIARVSHGERYLEHSYDPLGRRVASTDAAGNTLGYQYDGNDRVSRMSLTGGRTYQISYDRNGNISQMVMPGGAVHTFSYTRTDLDNSYVPPDSAPYLWFHDPDRAWVRTTFPSGKTLDATYDAGGRPTGWIYPEASVEIAYAAGDNTSRIHRVVRTPAENGQPQEVSLEYDGNLLVGKTFTGTSNGLFSYAYDNNFLLSGLSLDTGQEQWTPALSRDDDGLLISYGPFTFTRGGPAGAVSRVTDGVADVSITYDGMGRIVNRTHTVNAVQVYRIEVAYDNTGRISRKVESTGGTPHTFDYRYDADGQVVRVDKDGQIAETYGYDANGNRTSRQDGTAPPIAAVYDNQDRLTQQGNLVYLHDADGYRIGRGGDTFDYSARGELIEATVGGITVSYGYDGWRRRISRADGPTGTTQYLFGNPQLPFELTASRDDAGQLTVYYYILGRVLALERGGSRHYVATDPVGTPKVVTDNAGNVLKTLEYDTYGNVLSDSNPALFLPVGFAGGLSDPVTGLVRFGYRDYDPGAGRWMSKDPILFRGGDFNLYRYVRNDPVRGRDRSGLDGGDAGGISDLVNQINLAVQNQKLAETGSPVFDVITSEELAGMFEDQLQEIAGRNMTCAMQAEKFLDLLGSESVSREPFLMHQELLKSAKCSDSGKPLPRKEVEKNMKALKELMEKEALECKELFKF